MHLSYLQAISGNQKSDIGFFWSWSYWSTFILAWYVGDHKILSLNLVPPVAAVLEDLKRHLLQLSVCY
jgi:hypothetical protein